MKDQTIITNFNQLNNKYNKLIELTQQNLKQVYMIQTAASMTIEAMTNLLIDKGLITKDEVKQSIENIQQKRMEKSIESKEQSMKTQPEFNTDAGIPAPEGEN